MGLKLGVDRGVSSNIALLGATERMRPKARIIFVTEVRDFPLHLLSAAIFGK
jgi:hypothetical protein